MQLYALSYPFLLAENPGPHRFRCIPPQGCQSNLVLNVRNSAWFITLEIDLYNFGTLYQESLAQSTKRPWLGALALRRSRAGKPGPEGPGPKGPSWFQRRIPFGSWKRQNCKGDKYSG